MKVALAPTLEKFVSKKIKTGTYLQSIWLLPPWCAQIIC